MPIGQEVFHSSQQFDSNFVGGLSSIPESTDRYGNKVTQANNGGGRNQIQNPFRSQTFAEPPFFSTGNPMSTSIDQDIDH